MLLGRGDALALGAGEDVRGVAALVLVDRAALHVPHPGQTWSRNHRSWVTTTSAARRAGRWRGEPGDALDVEVVGRLVEDDQVLLVDEQPGQRDAAALATGQRADDGVELARQVEPAEQPGQHVADSRVARPLVVGAVADDLAPDGRRRVEGVVLRQHARAAGRRRG